MTLEEKQLKIITHYGEEHQLNKLIEECSELIQAICKWKLNFMDDSAIDYLQRMIEEMADVKNLIEQYELTDNYIEQEVADWKNIKIKRQLERMRR